MVHKKSMITDDDDKSEKLMITDEEKSTTLSEKSTITDDHKSTTLSEKSMITDDDKSTTLSEKSTVTDDEKSTTLSEKSMITDDEKSTTLSEKSTTDDEKSPTNEKLLVVGVKRKIDVDESDDDSDYFLSSDSESESEEVDWYEKEDSDLSILVNGRCVTDEEIMGWMEFPNKTAYDYRKTNKFLNQLRRFLNSVAQSEGFEAEHWPGSTWGITTIRPRKQVINKRNRYPEGYKYLIFLAEKAIQVYNTKNHTNYKVERIFNMNKRASMGYTYYITFAASSDDKQTFQAKVWDNIIDRYIKVNSCELKPGGVTYQSMDLEDEWLKPTEDISYIGSKSQLNDDQLWKWIEKSNPACCAKNRDKYLRKVRSYLESIEKSKGFECIDYPGRILGLTSIKPRQEIICRRNHFPEGYAYLCLLASDAIKVYNKAEGAQFDRAGDVSKANSLLVMGYGTYYITFEAADSHQDYLQYTFEAKVSDEKYGRNVEFCRRKIVAYEDMLL